MPTASRYAFMSLIGLSLALTACSANGDMNTSENTSPSSAPPTEETQVPSPSASPSISPSGSSDERELSAKVQETGDEYGWDEETEWILQDTLEAAERQGWQLDAKLEKSDDVSDYEKEMISNFEDPSQLGYSDSRELYEMNVSSAGETTGAFEFTNYYCNHMNSGEYTYTDAIIDYVNKGNAKDSAPVAFAAYGAHVYVCPEWTDEVNEVNIEIYDLFTAPNAL